MFTSWWQPLAYLAVLVVAYLAYRSYRRFAKRQRQAKFAVYGHVIKTFDLAKDGRVRYAQWLHPRETPKSIRQQDIDAVREYVRPGDLVIDIGAHSGDTTLPFAIAAGKQGLVLALEPNPYVHTILRVNAELNPRQTHIVPLCLAATDEDGEFTFHYSDGAYCNGGFLSQLPGGPRNHRAALQVQGRNLTRLLRSEYASWLPRLALVKVDTEGYDRQVLASLRDILREFHPVIVCEVFGGLDAAARDALFDELQQAGYDCFERASKGPWQGTAVTRESIRTGGHFDMLALPKDSATRKAVA
jgi:FkbM family methyltransferase